MAEPLKVFTAAQSRASNQYQSSQTAKPPRAPHFSSVETFGLDQLEENINQQNAVLGMRGIPITTSYMFGSNSHKIHSAKNISQPQRTTAFFNNRGEVGQDLRNMLQNYNNGAVSRAFNGNQTSKTSKMQTTSEDYNFMARGKTVLHEQRARSVLSNKNQTPALNFYAGVKPTYIKDYRSNNQQQQRSGTAKQGQRTINNGYNVSSQERPQSVGINNDNDDYRPFSVPYSPANQFRMKQPKISELARKTKLKDLGVTALEVNSGILKGEKSKGNLFSPVTQQPDAAPFFSEHVRFSEPYSNGHILNPSRSRSPEGSSIQGSPKQYTDQYSQNNQKKLQEFQFNQDLQLGSEIKQQVAINKLLTMNNFSRMLKNVQRSKKDLNHDHKVLQNVKLVSNLQSNIQDEIIKGRQQNHQAIRQFVDMTDNTLKRLIPREDAWQLKSHVQKNLNLKIHTAEMINSKRTSVTRATHDRKLSDFIGEAVKSVSNSPQNHNRAGSQGSRLSKSSLHKNRFSAKKKGGNFVSFPTEIVSNNQEQQNQDDNNSYDMYVETLSMRANMQHMISQNLIKVKYVKDQDKNKPQIQENDAQSRNNQQRPSATSEAFSSHKTIDEKIQAQKDKQQADEASKNENIVLDHEKCIIDFVSERDMFILKNKRKHRIIFNLDNISENGSSTNLLEIASMSVTDFIKNNRISPKLFHFDQFETIKSAQNKKYLYLQKSVTLLETQKIVQARLFLINAVKEFPGDPPLLFNKGLVHYLNKEYKESCRIYYELLGKISQKNSVLMNLFLSHLHLGEYEEIIDLNDQIEKKDDFLDYTEKQLRMIIVIAREKLQKEQPERHRRYMEIQRDKEVRANWSAKLKSQSSASPKNKATYPYNVSSDFTLVEQKDQRMTTVDIIDEEKVSIIEDDSLRTPGHHSDDTFGGKLQNNNHLTPHNNKQQVSETTRNNRDSTNLKVQFTQNFSEAFSSQASDRVTKDNQLEHSPPPLELGKVYELDDQYDNLKLVGGVSPHIEESEHHQILSDIEGIRKFCDGDAAAIELIQRFEKRRVAGSTKVVFQRSEELMARKYKAGLAALLDLNSKYYYLKYLEQTEEEDDKHKKIKIEPKKLLGKGGKELEEEEYKLMMLLGVDRDKVQERMKKYQQENTLNDKTKSNSSSFLAAEKAAVPLKEKEMANKEFEPKTFDFIQFLFYEYGLKEVIVPGTENVSIFQDIRKLDQLNAYVNKLSEFMTTKSIYFANDRQQLQNEDDQLLKDFENKKRAVANYDSDAEDHHNPDQQQQQPLTEQNMIEQFQNVLEFKIIEMLGDQNMEEADFYTQLLQKLNAIDLLHLFLKQCAKKIMGGERLLTFKKELSFGMLQIFREEISKKEVNARHERLGLKNNNKATRINYEMIDKTLHKLRFFKNFAQNIRLKLYSECKYEIVPPGRIIAHQEELESHIFVIISGIASLTVKYLETNESYSGMLIYPGDAIGDANIKDKIVISKGRGETKTYVSSVKECDVLVFERRQFTDVLFKDMMDSLYEKIMCMRNSEFFENLSPYAMVILCSNIELHEYSYGDVILRQECEPDECYIIISGECKLVLETVIYKPQEEKSAKKSSQVMKFGQQNYNPTERYGSAKSRHKAIAETKEKKLVNQRKLNEKFSFQHETLDFPEQQQLDSERSSSPMLRAPIINNTDIPFSEQKHGSKMIAYRHHLFYDKVAQGKVLCSRALLEKDYIRKFINKKYDHFKEQLDGPCNQSSSSDIGSQLDDNQQPSLEQTMRNESLSPKRPQSKMGAAKNVQFTDTKDHSKELEQDRATDIDRMYQDLMKSQLTVIADQAVVKVLKLTRKSKKYLSDPLKAMIDNRVYDTKFKDYDRPFKNEVEVQKFIEGQRKWEHFKDRISKNIVQKYVYK